MAVSGILLMRGARVRAVAFRPSGLVRSAWTSLEESRDVFADMDPVARKDAVVCLARLWLEATKSPRFRFTTLDSRRGRFILGRRGKLLECTKSVLVWWQRTS